jgi:hypothetical protein
MNITQYKSLISILIFSTIFYIVYIKKPNSFFREDGSLREFGIGYVEKTIIPLWLFSICLAIFAYLISYIIIYYLI